MPLKKATALLENLDGSVPFFEQCEWTQSLAAVAAVYRDDMDRVIPGPNRKVVQLIHTAAAAARTEWYLNNLRARHMISSKRLSLLPVGTTSNESLHHEINNFFRETPKIHKTTLSLKLKILQLSKLMTHNAALYYETPRQMAEAEVCWLARVPRKCGVLSSGGNGASSCRAMPRSSRHPCGCTHRGKRSVPKSKKASAKDQEAMYIVVH